MIETGINFGNIHSFYDLNLILSKKDIPPAQAKTEYLEIPGADGELDMTEVHGEVKYSSRECEFTFTVHPSEEKNWEEKKTEVNNKLNGKVFDITLDTDPDYYYKGRCLVTGYEKEGKVKQFIVSAKVEPYKYRQHLSISKHNLAEIPKEIIIISGRKPVSPEITCTDDNTLIVFGGVTYNLSAGTHEILDIRFAEGENILTVSGSGKVTFTFQEGEL